MSTGIEGKIALVTGSSRGIGKSIALALAREGAIVVTNSLEDVAESEKTVKAIRALGSKVLSCDGDVTDDSFVREMFQRVTSNLGEIDILVNNVGGSTNTPFRDLDADAWDDVVRRNLRTTFVCTKLALPSMEKRGFGRVINISSQLAMKGGFQLAHYAAAKAGVIGFTKSLALEYASTGITVNAIAPGRIATELSPGSARVSEEWLTRKLQEIPMRRFGRVENVAPTAVLIASSPGGDFYTGQVFHPNGGEVMP